jgi:hypothetical protein
LPSAIVGTVTIRSAARDEVPSGSTVHAHENPTDEARGVRRIGIGARELTIGALTTSAVVHAVLVPQHTSEPLLAASFAAATVAAALLAFALTRPSLRFAPALAAALFASLLVAYPIVHLLTDGEVQALDIGTKFVEAVGLLAALNAGDDEEVSFAPLTVIVGVFLAVLLVSISGGHHHH